LKFRASTSYTELARRTPGLDQSSGYMKTTYNSIVLVPEIQMNNDVVNTPDKMMTEGGKFPKILHDWLVNNR